MDTALEDRNSAQSRSGHANALSEPRSRGRLVLSKRVVEKIASQAALEIATAGGRSGGFFGFGSHADLSSRPTVRANLSGRTATIDVEVAIAYPHPIGPAAEQVRRQMMERVSSLAGVRVSRVDVTVTVLARADKQRDVLR